MRSASYSLQGHVVTFLGWNIQISSKFCVLKITKIGSILTDLNIQDKQEVMGRAKLTHYYYHATI